MVAMLKDLHPHIPWKIFLFMKAPNGYWKVKEHQLELLRHLESTLSIICPEDWYDVAPDQLQGTGAPPLLQSYYRNSLSTFLTAMYPSYPWKPYRFRSLPKLVYKDPEVLAMFVRDFEEAFLLREPSDWYRIGLKQITVFGGGTLITKNGGLYRSLLKVYPTIPWDKKKIAGKGKRSSQWIMVVCLRKIFPDLVVI
eukprot:TRINITY_DN10852_c0_g1_i1.p1 TRINITY_DN10852_c0_g1~~TRINITY_DN10852_c0_g1_i1.p1  ORF type:complete len:196 (-),score=26.54 TRINITY_DN10852_c0_g1_i1:504-1091(-)